MYTIVVVYVTHDVDGYMIIELSPQSSQIDVTMFVYVDVWVIVDTLSAVSVMHCDSVDNGTELGMSVFSDSEVDWLCWLEGVTELMGLELKLEIELMTMLDDGISEIIELELELLETSDEVLGS